ncbi:MAG: M1 family peptidase [Austwickia sp.]|nr:M1 family peptidase [Austwickia sp.]
MDAAQPTAGPRPTRARRRRVAAAATLAVIAATASACAGAVPSSAGSPGSPLTTAPATSTTTALAATAPGPTPPPSGTGPSSQSVPAVRPAPVLPEASLVAGVSTPVEDPYYPGTSNPEVDALHYGLDLDWDGRTLRGVTQLTFRAARDTTTIRLALARNLAVTSATLDGRAVSARRPGNDVVFATGSLAQGSRHVLVIRYVGRPGPVKAPSGRPDMTEGLGWNRSPAGNVYTFQEPYGAFTWYPVHDHPSDKARYDATVRVPRGQVGVFNGSLTKTESLRGKTVTRWHLDRPAASYLITIAIGAYRQTSVRMPDGKPFTIWLLPAHEKLRPAIAKEALRSYSWLLKKAGPYPFASSGVVVVEGASAMETQTMITAGYGIMQTELNPVLLHELAHQWYGNSVGPIDWLAVWLNEGWATRMQQDYEDPQGAMFDVQALDTMCRWSRVIAGPAGRYDPKRFADDNVYICPAGMLTELRNTVGVAAYDAIAQAWPVEHRDRTVNRATFLAWLNEKTGQDQSDLLRRWLD